MPIDEVELSGGNLTSGIVRVGDTVRRPAGAWTPAVHALLLHLEKAGFEASPRVLGIDQRGREILTYIAGRVAWPWENFAPVATRDGLSKIAQIIHAYHAAVSSFVPPRDAKWSELCPRNGAEIICHNDFAPWNLIVGPSGSFTFIDWDLAAPGPRLSDLAYSARTFVPLNPDCPFEVPVVERLWLLCDVWAVQPSELLDAVVWRARSDLEGLRARAQAREKPWVDLWNAGHGAAHERTLKFIEENAARWLGEMR